MMPLTFPIAHVSIFAANILFVLSWATFSFLFWRGLRRWAVDEDRIFDLTFYATLVSFVVARAGFIVTHWSVFVGRSPLLMLALWIAPGLSWLGTLLGGLGTLVMLSRQYKVRLGLVLDTLSTALPLPIIIGEIASLLNGLEIGVPSSVPWAIRFVGYDGVRHPVQLYEMIALVGISALIVKISAMAVRKKWAYGMVGISFFMIYSFLMFMLEFLKDSRVYWGQLRVNQWILIAVFAECIGVVYVRGGGREAIRPLIHAVHSFIEKKGKSIYAAIPKRRTG